CCPSCARRPGEGDSQVLEELPHLQLRRLAARGVADAGRAAVAVPVPDVDALQERRADPDAAEGGEGAALLVQVGRAARAFVPGGGGAAGARAVAELGEE